MASLLPLDKMRYLIISIMLIIIMYIYIGLINTPSNRRIHVIILMNLNTIFYSLHMQMAQSY